MQFVPGLRSKVLDSRTPALHRLGIRHRRADARQLAGTLCPNPVLADGRRLDSILGDGFALITARRPTTRCTSTPKSAAPLSISPPPAVNSPTGFAAAARRRRSSDPTARSCARAATCARSATSCRPSGPRRDPIECLRCLAVFPGHLRRGWGRRSARLDDRLAEAFDRLERVRQAVTGQAPPAPTSHQRPQAFPHPRDRRRR